MLLMITAAALSLSAREVWWRGSFPGGVAVGVLLVGPGIEWAEYLRPQRRAVS